VHFSWSKGKEIGSSAALHQKGSSSSNSSGITSMLSRGMAQAMVRVLTGAAAQQALLLLVTRTGLNDVSTYLVDTLLAAAAQAVV
jgi:hypothetical protein